MKYSYNTKGTCSSRIDFEVNDGIISNVKFYGGCSGNLNAISVLVEGMTVEQVKSKLLNNKCGSKNTSCADQLAKALIQAIENL